MRYLLTILCISVGTIGCSHHVDYGGHKFRTGGASGAWLGSWGDKLLDGPNSYGRQSKFREKWGPIEFSISTTEKHFEISKLKLALAGLNYKRLADLGFDMDIKLKEGFKVTVFTIDSPADLVRLINANDNLKSELRKDERSRIVIAVAKIYDHEFESNVIGNITPKMSFGKLALGEDIEFKFKGDRTVTKKISDGTIVGYRFSRICWNADGTVNKLVEDRPLAFFRSDRGQCPKNTTAEVDSFQ